MIPYDLRVEVVELYVLKASYCLVRQVLALKEVQIFQVGVEVTLPCCYLVAVVEGHLSLVWVVHHSYLGVEVEACLALLTMVAGVVALIVLKVLEWVALVVLLPLVVVEVAHLYCLEELEVDHSALEGVVAHLISLVAEALLQVLNEPHYVLEVVGGSRPLLALNLVVEVCYPQVLKSYLEEVA